MAEYNALLIKNCIVKASAALSDAEYLLKDERKSLALNRIYYAVFYIVQALAYKDGFITSKHSQLMGWFNKKYIHEAKTFPQRLNEIYKNAFANRQEADYDLLTAFDLSVEQVQIYLEDSKYFVEVVWKYLSV
jgi:uncharacterized protein (UPF0332 family)